MDIITRLNEFVSQRGLSSSQFADLLGIPRPSASQILSGRNKKISNEFLGKLHYAFPDLDLMWLMFGETSPFVATSRSEQTMSHEKSKISDSAPTLFDTQSNMSYSQDKNSLTDSESACEGVIDVLKTLQHICERLICPITPRRCRLMSIHPFLPKNSKI